MARASINHRNGRPAAARPLTALAVILAVIGFLLPAARASADTPVRTARQMTVTGRLVGPDAKGVAGGQVAVIVQEYRRSERPEGNFFGWGLALTAKVLATAEADADGSFRLSGPGYSPSLPYTAVALLASAPGHGLTFKDLDLAELNQNVTVTLPAERVVRGRLIDLQGQPAAQAKVHVVWPVPELRSFWFDKPLEGALPFWPRTVTADDKGRFLVRGLGGEKVTLEARQKQHLAPQELEAQTLAAGDPKETTFSVVGARRFQGQITYADSHQPAPNARILAIASPDEFGMGYQKVEGRTDGQGRFSLNVFPGEYLRVIVHPPEGTPYRTLRQVVPWGQAARQETRLALPRGILVRGKVTEASTGQPVAGTRVQFRPRENNNPFYRRDFQAGATEENLETAITGPDGRFQLAALPGPGHLLVLGPTLDYVHVTTSWGQLEYGRPGGIRYYPDGLAALDLKPGTEAPEVAVELRRGVTVKGRVVGPDGKPVERFLVYCRSYMPTGFEWWQREMNVLEGRDGRFELPGCEPGKSVTAWFIDRGDKFGATAVFSADAAGAPVTVRLQPCGTAVARFVNAEGKPASGNFNGKPVPNYHPFFSMVITPGASMAASQFTGHDDKKDLEADWFSWGHAPAGFAGQETDAQGRATFAALIPGATYRLMLPQAPKGDGQEIADKGYPTKDFSVRPGQTLDLGTITVAGQ